MVPRRSLTATTMARASRFSGGRISIAMADDFEPLIISGLFHHLLDESFSKQGGALAEFEALRFRKERDKFRNLGSETFSIGFYRWMVVMP